jgi:SAM-dependent methyltransferase
MALTEKLRNVVDCFPDPTGDPDLERLEASNDELFEMIRGFGWFPVDGVIRLLDIGSGIRGSDFVNRFEREFSKTEIVYLDFSQNNLEKSIKLDKICANAVQMPFVDGCFDIAYAGHIISEGVLKNHWHFKDNSYRIAREAYRVLKKDGLFIFTYCRGDDARTLVNLWEIGFRGLEHLQRIKWYGGMPTDTYAVKK